MIYEISHRTRFSYSQQVSISHHLLHLKPRPCPRQETLRASIIVDPAPSLRSESIDYFGNPVTYLMVQEPHSRLVVHAAARIEVAGSNPFALELSRPWEEVARIIEDADTPEPLSAAQFAFASPYVELGQAVYDYAIRSFPAGRPVFAGTRDLMARIHREFAYEGGVTDVSTPVGVVLRTRKGVCQDFAHLQIACLRSLGLSARYTSGYLLTHPPEGQERLVGSDATHAWLSVWCPDLGWVDFDPTNDMLPDQEHITLAWGRDYGDVSPINGFMFGGGSHKVDVAVDVAPVPGDWAVDADAHGDDTTLVRTPH